MVLLITLACNGQGDSTPDTETGTEATGGTASTGETGLTSWPTLVPDLMPGVQYESGTRHFGIALAGLPGALAVGAPSYRTGRAVGSSRVNFWTSPYDGQWPSDGFLRGPDQSEAGSVWQFADGRNVLAPGDVTGDAVEDIAMFGHPNDLTDFGTSGFLFPGPLLGAFHAHDEPDVVPLGAALTGARCGDVSGDGVGDLCLDTGVHFGPVGPTLDLAFWSDAVSRPDVRVAASDLDGDGDAELVVWEPGVGLHRIDTFPTGTHALASLATATLTPPSGDALVDLAGGEDIDGDGRQDIVAAFEGDVFLLTDVVAGALDEVATTHLLAVAEAVAVGDLDGDGETDLVVGDGYSIRVYLGPISPGELELGHAAHQWTGVAPHSGFGEAVLLDDIDADGQDDLVVGAPDDLGPYTTATGGYYTGGRVYVALGPL